MDAAGGWISDDIATSAEITDAMRAINEAAGTYEVSHPFRVSSEQRQVTEDLAMECAIAHFTAEGWAVIDVSKHESYDLACTNRMDRCFALRSRAPQLLAARSC